MAAEAMVLGSFAPTSAWYWMGGNTATSTRQDLPGRQDAALRQNSSAAAPRATTAAAWLTAEDVALLVVRGEYLEAGVTVPQRFAPQALESARKSVLRWTAERRIFQIHDLYPRYQFDGFGRPRAAIERAIAALGTGGPLHVGNWFSAPNRHLDGKRPQQLLDFAPDEVMRALARI
jgi:hypothetical protein